MRHNLFRNLLLAAAFSLLTVSGLFAENSYIYIDNEDVKPYLKLAAEYETNQQWRAAIEQYEFLLAKYPAALCKIDSNKYASIRQYYIDKLKSYPPTGRQVYRDLFDAPSQALFTQALTQFINDRNADTLKELVDRRLFSSIGARAARLIGDYYSESGEIDTAVNYYQKALDSIKWCSETEPPGTSGRDDDAGIIKLRLAHYTRLANSMNEQLTDTFSWLKWGGNNANSLTIREADEPITGTLALAWEHLFNNILAVPIKKENAGQLQFPLCYPAISGDYAYLNLGKCVIAIKLNSGKIESVFPANLNINTGFKKLDKTTRIDHTGGILTRSFITLSPSRIPGNQPSPAVATKYLYTPLLKTEVAKNGRLYLVCLETPSLKEIWSTPLGFSKSLISAPLVYDNKVFICLFIEQANEWQLCVDCFDALTGDLIYGQVIYTLNINSNANYAKGALIMPPHIAESKGIIYCLTPSILAALEPKSGEVIWLNSYSADETTAYIRNPDPSQTQISFMNYPVIKENTIAIQTIYGGKILGFDLLTGREKWQQTVPLRQKKPDPSTALSPIIGCLNKSVVFQGDEITSINILNGKLLWKIPLASIDETIIAPFKKYQIGQGFITNRYAYLPEVKGIVVLTVPPQESKPAFLEFPDNFRPPGTSDKTFLYKTGEKLLVISDQGICLYKIEK